MSEDSMGEDEDSMGEDGMAEEGEKESRKRGQREKAPADRDPEGAEKAAPGNGDGEDLAEAIALYAVGSLSPEEASAFEELLSGGSFVGAEELRAYQEVLSQISKAVAAGAPAPPAELKQKLLERIEAGSASSPQNVQVWKSWPAEASSADPGLVVKRAAEGGWETTPVAGVSVKSLHVDPVRRYVTMLVKMDAGVSYPGHLHAAAEECYVLDGDLRVGDQVLKKGDYQRAEAGSKHGVQSTKEGCLLLVLSSQNDELLPS
jgi:quercetin dioxygenase-like cupin family protein